MIELVCFFLVFIFAYFLDPVRKGPLVLFVFFGLVLQYGYAISYAISGQLLDSYFFVGQQWILLSLAVVVGFATLQLFSIPSVKRGRAVHIDVAPLKLRLEVFFFMTSLLGVLLMYRIMSGFDFSDRLIARAGSGYLFMCGYAGLAYCLSIASGITRDRSAVVNFLLVLPTSLFFLLAGHRSVAIISLSCALVAPVSSYIGGRRILFATVSAAIISIANPINMLTGSIRSLYSEGKDLSVDSVMERFQELSEAQVIPLANSHLEMMAGYLQSAKAYDLFLGTYATLIPSVLNFLPRIIFPDKGWTSGVHFTSVFFPQWFSFGAHSSSLTTGIYLDLLFNFGFLVSPIIIVLLYVLIARANRGLAGLGGCHATFGLYLAWLFGFNIFFDDMGGVVNKLVLGVAFYCAAICFELITAVKGKSQA